MHDHCDPLEWFGLDAGASVRDLKRAYAQRLKTTRPDEDPEGFQALRSQYEAALWVIENDVTVAEPRATPIVFDAPALVHVETEPALDIDALYAQILSFGRADSADALRRFLLANDASWSFAHKRAAAEAIADTLWRDLPPFGADAFDVLLGFFDEWRIDRGRDPIGAACLRENLVLRWYLLPEHAEQFGHEATLQGIAPSPRSALASLRQVQRPFVQWQALLLALIPGVPTRMRRFLQGLGLERVTLPPGIDSEQATFWNAAGNRREGSMPRTLVGLTRAAAYAVATLPLLAGEIQNWISAAMHFAGLSICYAVVWFGAFMTTVQRERADGAGIMPIWGLLFGGVMVASMFRSCATG